MQRVNLRHRDQLANECETVAYHDVEVWSYLRENEKLELTLECGTLGKR